MTYEIIYQYFSPSQGFGPESDPVLVIKAANENSIPPLPNEGDMVTINRVVADGMPAKLEGQVIARHFVFGWENSDADCSILIVVGDTQDL